MPETFYHKKKALDACSAKLDTFFTLLKMQSSRFLKISHLGYFEKQMVPVSGLASQEIATMV